MSSPPLSTHKMAALPSFVQLMASLGLSDRPTLPPTTQGASSPAPQSTRPECIRSHSSPSLRELAGKQYASRYSPYSPTMSFHKRKGSLCSISSTSDLETSPTFIRSTSSSRTRRFRHKVSRSDSSSDISVEAPISTYVRRKTPGSSPISPNFEQQHNSATASHLAPFSIPTLPILLTNSENLKPHPSPSVLNGEIIKNQDYYRFIRQRRGTRISAARATRSR